MAGNSRLGMNLQERSAPNFKTSGKDHWTFMSFRSQPRCWAKVIVTSPTTSTLCFLTANPTLSFLWALPRLVSFSSLDRVFFLLRQCCSQLLPNPGEARAALQNVIKDGNRAAEVVDTVRAMYKKEQTDKTRLNLNDLINSVLYLLRDELQPQQIIVRTNLDPRLPSVLGHRGELQQVILNLIRNAADAMKDVTYRPRVLTVKSEVQPPNSVLISVADSGTGIDPRDIDHIFDAFFTTKLNGMGMGLSICRSIIEDHSGRLWALPNLKYGSVFNISLPTHQDGVKRLFGSGPSHLQLRASRPERQGS
jgi:signal transduction histidine kinase